jgi:Ca2+-binding EF-hand superfamily protein
LPFITNETKEILMKSKLFSILAVMVSTGFGGVAVPVQAAERESPPAFSEVDKNGDGYISQDATKKWPSLAENFSLMDKSGDGRISKEEYAPLDIHTPPE